MSATSEQYLRDFPIPLIGFAAFSGTGKTTLLLQLLPLLKRRGLRVGVIKHAHHTFDCARPAPMKCWLPRAAVSPWFVSVVNLRRNRN